jgi:hypothetical protein
MEMPNAGAGRRITATDRDTMELELNAAVAIAQERAVVDGGKGILVTRHSLDSFSVTLSDKVPFGLTQELDLRA